MPQALGIDIGGTKIKAGLVNTASGQIITEIRQVETPAEVGPQDLAELISDLIGQFNWQGTVGIGYPGVVIAGRTYSAAHLSNERESIVLHGFIPNTLRKSSRLIF